MVLAAGDRDVERLGAGCGMKLPEQQLEQDQERQAVAVEPVWKSSRRELQRRAHQAAGQRGDQVVRMDLSHHPSATAEFAVTTGERLQLIAERHAFIQHDLLECSALGVRQIGILRKRLGRGAQVGDRRAQSLRRQLE